MKTNRLNSDILEELVGRHNLSLLVTDQLNKTIPIYRWYNYKHSFSKELVIELFRTFSFDKNSKKKILDPFCGAGTTLLAAKEYGLAGYGIDVMPFPAYISEAKTANYDAEMLCRRYTRLKKHIEIYCKAPNYLNRKRELLKNYFSEKILDWVLYVYSWSIHQSNRTSQHFFLTALFSILESISQMKKDGGFLRNFSRDIQVETAAKKLMQQIEMMLDDIVNMPIGGTVPQIFIDDIRCVNTAGHVSIKKGSVDAIITSPPYPNRHDYTRIYGLESILGFSQNANDIKRVRYNTLRSHVEAKESSVDSQYKCPEKLLSIIEELKGQSLPNNEVIPMLKGYFEDMYGVLRKLYAVLKSQGFFALVVCDVRYGGVVVPVGDLLAECAKNVGFTMLKKITARSKNNSSQQMKKYGKHPIGEYIFIWQK